MFEPVPTRRTEGLPQVGDYFASPERYYNQIDEQLVINVRSGEYHVTDGPGELMVTVLGSCIATCIFDPVTKVGGMNHFLVPGDPFTDPSPKYGVFAMEFMINEILKRGGIKTRLVVKVFGGARITERLSTDIGLKNIAFIQEYLANESLSIASSDMGGECARRVHFCGDDGKVKLRRLQRQSDFEHVAREEETYDHSIEGLRNPGSIELFGA